MPFWPKSWQRLPDFPVDPRNSPSPGKGRWSLVVGVAVIVLLAGGIWWSWPRLRPLWAGDRQTATVTFWSNPQFFEYVRQLEATARNRPRRFEVQRLLTHAYEMSGDPRARATWLQLRVREPGNLSNHLGLIRCVLRDRDFAHARLALADARDMGYLSIAYFQLLGQYGLSANDDARLAEARAQLDALEADPIERSLNRAIIELVANDTTVHEQAHATLIALARGPRLRIRAGLALTRDMLSSFAQEALYEEICGDQVEGPVGDLEFLAYLQAQPEPTVTDVALLVGWMNQHDLAPAALEWLDDLPERLRLAPAVTIARTESIAQLGAWSSLREMLAENAWGPIQRPPLNLASAAWIQQERFNSARALNTWRDGLTLAQESAMELSILAEMARLLSWPEAEATARQMLAKHFPAELEQWPLKLRFERFQAKADDALATSKQWQAVEPRNPRPRALEAYLAVLGGNPSISQQVAIQDATAKSDPILRAASALFLWRSQERFAARDIARDLLPLAHREPSVGVVCCLILADELPSADRDRVTRYVQAAQLFPAERTALEKVGVLRPRAPGE